MGVIVRLATPAATHLRREAWKLGAQVIKKGGGAINRIRETFLLRAVGNEQNCVVTILDLSGLLGGSFGGTSVGTTYFTPFAGINRPVALGQLLRTSISVDPETGQNIPYDPPLERYFTKSPDGRVVIGTVPNWIDLSNATVADYHTFASAILTVVCPTFELVPPLEGFDKRTLLLYRLSGHMRFDFGDPPDPIPGPGLPTFTVEAHTGPPGALAYIEFGTGALGLSGAEVFGVAGGALEWGPLAGLISAEAKVKDEDGIVDQRVVIARYAITESVQQEQRTYAGAVDWTAKLHRSTVPDPPTDIPAASSVVPPGLNLPAWAFTYGAPEGRAATKGGFSVDRIGMLRLWAAGAGYEAALPEAAMTLCTVNTTRLEPNLNVEGWYNTTPFTYQTVSVPIDPYIRQIVYAVSISPSGALTFTKLSEFHASRYDTAHFDDLERVAYRSVYGINAFDGSPRLVCWKRTHHLQVTPADPDIPEVPGSPGSPRIQGEPARKTTAPDDSFTRVQDIKHVLISPSGGETPLALGSWYVPYFTNDDHPVGGSSGRLNYMLYGPNDTEPRYANESPAPFCRYAPGILAALVAADSGFTSPTQSLRIALFSVATGALLQVGPVVLQFTDHTTMWLTCVEQGTVDDQGALLSHARLLLTASTTSNLPNRQDGTYVLSDLGAGLSWVNREPSNVPLHYLGNRLWPAEIGVTTRVEALKSKPLAP